MSVRSRRRFRSSCYDELMANHAICLLTYLAENPSAKQTYYALERKTGIPAGTIWHLVNWDHEMAPWAANPLFVWAWNLGYYVEISSNSDLRIKVVKRDIWDVEESQTTI